LILYIPWSISRDSVIDSLAGTRKPVTPPIFSSPLAKAVVPFQGFVGVSKVRPGYSFPQTFDSGPPLLGCRRRLMRGFFPFRCYFSFFFLFNSLSRGSSYWRLSLPFQTPFPPPVIRQQLLSFSHTFFEYGWFSSSRFPNGPAMNLDLGDASKVERPFSSPPLGLPSCIRKLPSFPSYKPLLMLLVPFCSLWIFLFLFKGLLPLAGPSGPIFWSFTGFTFILSLLFWS